jgi:hypothetical protein
MAEGEELRMRVASIALIALLTSTVIALSEDLPTLNVKPVCRGIALQGSDPSERGGPDLSFNNCIDSEEQVRNELTKAWSTFAPADKGHCVRETTMGGLSSYTDLITCLEMARDVRKLRSEMTKGID